MSDNWLCRHGRVPDECRQCEELAAKDAEIERLRDALLWYEDVLKHCRRTGLRGEAAIHRLRQDAGRLARNTLAGGNEQETRDE